MPEHPTPHWSWSVPGPVRKRRGLKAPHGGPTPARTQGGWLRPAAPAKCAPTVFIGAPVTRSRRSGSR